MSANANLDTIRLAEFYECTLNPKFVNALYKLGIWGFAALNANACFHRQRSPKLTVCGYETLSNRIVAKRS